MPEVDVLCWNPVRPVYSGRLGRVIRFRRPVNNFGDMLGPMIVQAMLSRYGLTGAAAARDAQLLTVGSVMHLAKPGAVVWGTGVNFKVDPADDAMTSLDVRAVRGPRTRDFLESRGVAVPEVFGDPALLLPEVFPEFGHQSPTRDVTVVPNLNERSDYGRSARVLHPRRPPIECLKVIGASRLVVGSSLHGIIVAEAYGIPARLVRPRTESELKYDDYYLATGRPDWSAAASVEDAIKLGGERPPKWSSGPLVDTFPIDLWTR